MDEKIGNQMNKTQYENPFAWFAAGFVLPLASQRYYKAATRKKAGWAVLFFFVLISIISLLITLNLTAGFIRFQKTLAHAYETGQIPSIIIEDGIAQISDKPTWVFIDREEMLIAIDTTGEYITEIDRYQYEEGLLLTKTHIHIYNDGRYQLLPLISFKHDLDINPIVLNQKNVERLYILFIAAFLLMTFISVWCWYGLIKFMYLVAIGLVFWGIVSIFKKVIGFEKILILGIYAYFAALVLTYVFGLVSIKFLFLETILMTIIWGIHLYYVLKKPETSEEEKSAPKVNLKIAYYGAPIIILLASNLIFDWISFPQLVVIATLVTMALIYMAEQRKPATEENIE